MCLIMPMALLFNFFITKKESVLEYIRKYLSLCFINNLLCYILLAIYSKNTFEFKETYAFYIKYSLLSLGIGILMIIVYKIFKNFVEVKLEVVNEKSKKK